MTQDQEPQEQVQLMERWRDLLVPTIRRKIILPYLILTLIVAIIGTYVVTNLVASSLEERLTNQLLEAGRVVSDSLARREIQHLESARTIAFTVGLAEALQEGDQDKVAALAQPAATVRGVECLIIVDSQAEQTLHLLQQNGGSLESVEEQFDAAGLWMVQELLAAGDPNARPRRGLVLHLADQRYYYLTAIPVELDNRFVGVAVVGTSLDTLLPHFKTTALADVIIYVDGGRAIATTLAFVEDPTVEDEVLDELSIDPELYQSALQSTTHTTGENVPMHGRSYRLARGPLQVGDDKLAVFAVALPSHFIIRAGTASRNTYALIFSIATACVILVGYLISQRITNPLGRLVRTSRAVAEGDLQQRTGIESGDEIGILATTFDEMTTRLSERTHTLNETLDQLEETLSRTRAILSSIGDGVLLEDLEGRFIPLNAAAETLLEEMAANFVLGPLRELAITADDHSLDAKPSPWRLESRRFQLGKKVISAHSAAVRTDDGDYLGTVIVLRDVTAEAATEKLKDAFITHVSHELRTPLTAIKGYSDLLLTRAGDALNREQRNFLKTITLHTEDLMTMINSLLDFTELEARDRLGMQRRPVSLIDIVEKLAADWHPQMDEKELAFRVEIPGQLPKVNADAKRLRWAILNLVRNAWQYTPAGGSVTLQLFENDGRVILTVADTGVGIPAEEQDLLFSRLYRLQHRPEDDTRGLGLGLYVSKAIVEAHGGEIRVASEEGVGSTFSMILPSLSEQSPT